jgi:hypothetical protein
VPFEEDLKNPLIWYLDHNYLESMFYMFKKINGEHTDPHEWLFISVSSLVQHA